MEVMTVQPPDPFQRLGNGCRGSEFTTFKTGSYAVLGPPCAVLRISFITLLFALSFTLSAQQKCGTDELRGEKMGDPRYKVRYAEFNKAVRNATASGQNGRTQTKGTVYTIPVVFHVMHKGEPERSGVNLSNAQIHAALKDLNERFRKVPGSVGDGRSVDMAYQFALAVRDPAGNCTDGINRIDMTCYPDYMKHGIANSGMDEVTLKSLSYWDSKSYCNIWIVSNIQNYGGYSTFPYNHGEPWDGVLIAYNFIASQDYPTLTHELGHYVGLEHVFLGANGNSCPINEDCVNQGDGVCDTPPQLEGASCELTPNPCVPDTYVAATNYMSYSCLQEFTTGQKERSRVAFDLYRTSLLEVNGNMALVPAGTPSPDFIVASQGSCATAGSKIQFLDRTPCIARTFINSLKSAGTSFKWTMTDDAGVSLTSTDQNPTFTIPVDGRYDVTLTVTTPQGTNSVTKQDLVIATGSAPLASACDVRTSGDLTYPDRTDDIGIREVILSDLHHRSGTSVADVTTGLTGPDGYGDFSCTEKAALEPCTEYTIRVVLGETNPEHVHVYIDFNNNGIADDDLVTFAHDIPAASGVYTLPPFTTPCAPVFNKRLRMRVVDAEGSEPYPTSCGIIGFFGQIHDYSVMFNNVSPVAHDDAATILEDKVVVVNVTKNDTDADGTLLDAADLDPSTPLLQGQVSTPEGVWKSVKGGNVSFTPNRNFNGVATVQYTISDNRSSESLPATITVTVTPVNDAPSFTKGPDILTGEDGGAQTFTGWANSLSTGAPNETAQVLAFDVVNSNDTLFAVPPFISANGDLTYTSVANGFGESTVAVTLKDNGGTANGGRDASAVQTFVIRISPVNDPPQTAALAVATIQGLPVSGDLSAGDFDVEGSISYVTTPVSGPGHGSIVVQPQGTFVYTPDDGFAGVDTIVIEACDDGIPELCVTKILTIDVQPVTGIEPLPVPVSVYPNPSSGEFRLSVPTAWQNSQVKVFDLLGRVVYEFVIQSETVIDLSQQVRGTYLLRVEQQEKDFTTRIVLK